MNHGYGTVCVTQEPHANALTTWAFREIDGKLCFISYVEEERPSARQKFRSVQWYNVYDRRNRTMELDEVPMPMWVLHRAVSLWRLREVKIMDGPGHGAKLLYRNPEETKC